MISLNEIDDCNFINKSHKKVDKEYIKADLTELFIRNKSLTNHALNDVITHKISEEDYKFPVNIDKLSNLLSNEYEKTETKSEHIKKTEFSVQGSVNNECNTNSVLTENSSMDSYVKIFHSDITSCDYKPIRRNPIKSVSIKAKDFMIFICCCKAKNLKIKSLLKHKAEEKFNINLDIVTLIKKIQEIDILKFLILDLDSLNLMNFICKPIISAKNELSNFEHERFFNYEDSIFNHLQDNVYEIKESLDNILSKEKQTRIDERLLNLFLKQVREISS